MEYIDVLIVDDEINLCSLVCQIFNSKNISCAGVYSMDAAMIFFERTIPRVILFDYSLGYSFLPIMHFKLPETIIFIITAQDPKMVYEKILPSYIAGVIFKPFSIGEIIDKVQNKLKVSSLT